MIKNKINNKIKVLVLMMTVFAVTSIFLTIETATVGAENTYLEEKQSKLIFEKKELENSFVKGISMTKLEEDSVASGFVKPTNYLYINGDEQVASLH